MHELRKTLRKLDDPVLLLMVVPCNDKSGADPGFFKGGGGGGGGEGGWYPGATETVGHAAKRLQFENWSLIENHFTSNTSNATK